MLKKCIKNFVYERKKDTICANDKKGKKKDVYIKGNRL